MTMALIDEGSYLANGVELSFIVAKTGTEGATVLFELADGRRISWTGWLSEKCLARTGESLALCGYDGADDATISRQTVQLVIEHEDYDDPETGESKTTHRVKWVNDPNRSVGMGEPMTPAQATVAKQRLRGVVLAAAKAKGSAGPGTSFPHGANAPPAGGVKPKF
jgi:hypothetical protein